MQNEKNTEAEKNSSNEIPISIETVEDGIEFTYGIDTTSQNEISKKTETKPEIAGNVKSGVQFEVEEQKKTEEFVVPEKYGEKPESPSNTPVSEGAAFKPIWNTYVPHFTEASEKYRLGIYRPDFYQKKEKKAEEELEDANSIDPTAEIEEDAPAVETEPVVVENKKEPGTEQAKMFKFAFEDDGDELSDSVADKKATQDNLEERKPFYVPQEPPVKKISSKKIEKKPEDNSDDASDDEFEESKSTPVTTFEYEEKKRQYEEPTSDIGDKIIESDKREYTVLSQRDSFIDKFLDSIVGIKIRFFTAAVLSLLVLIFENLFLFGLDVPTFLGISQQPASMAILDLLFVACMYLLVLPEVIRSFRMLLKKQLIPEFNLTISLVLVTVYTVVCVAIPEPKYALFGLVFALMCLAAISASYFKKNAEHTSFALISQNGEKRIIDIKNTADLERENIALDGAIKEHKSKTARFFRTTFVSGFFRRIEKNSENCKNNLLILGVSLGFAVVSAIIALIIWNVLIAVTVFVLVYMISTPLISVLAHKLPYLAVTEEFKKESTAFIGEQSVLDYSKIDVITFEDTEVFGADDVNLQRIMLYGKNENLSKALKQMSALFQKVGGPLDVLFSKSLDRKCPPAYNTYVEEDGVEGEIDYKTVCAGTMDYMIRHRVTVPEEEGRQTAPISNTTRVIYAAEDGVIYAKFYIRYSFSEEFSMLFPILEEEEIVPLIYTRDPNISPEFIRTLTAGNDRIRIMKKRTSPVDDNMLYRRVNIGAVALGDKMNSINALLLTKRYSRMSKTLSKVELAFSILGALGAAVLSFLSLTGIPTVFFALYEGALLTWLFAYVRKKIYISPFQN